MSLMFKPPTKDRVFDPKLVKVMLNENALLIKIVAEYQNKGKVHECMKYHDILTRNLLYLSGISDFQADDKFSAASELCKTKFNVKQESVDTPGTSEDKP